MTLFLIAHIAGRGVAVDAADVELVIDIGAIVPVPRASNTVLGIAALRSRTVTVIDSWRVLGVQASRNPPRALVTRIDGHDYAMLFDSVDDAVSLETGPVPPGLALDGAWARAARGVTELDGEPMLVIGLDALVPAAA